MDDTLLQQTTDAASLVTDGYRISVNWRPGDLGVNGQPPPDVRFGACEREASQVGLTQRCTASAESQRYISF